MKLGLCNRRNWAEPYLESHRTRSGSYTATARVNNREYTTGNDEFPTPELARDAAACQAYIICRNFSVNDGMYPGDRPNQGGIVQGLPIAIGTERQGTSKGSSSSSKTSTRRPTNTSQQSTSGSERGSDRRSSSGSTVSSSLTALSSSPPGACPCGRAAYGAFDRCKYCLRREGFY